MADLIEQFFTRDLSEAEHEALSKLLQDSPEAAQKYERLLEQNYLATGLPQPQLPKGLNSLPETGGSLLGKGALLKLLAVGLAGLAAGLIWKFWPMSNPVTSPASQQPVQAVSPKPAQPAVARQKPAPVQPLAAGPSQEGQELSVVLNTGQKSLVTVRILDGQGNEVRALYTGFVEPGHWSFQWDGLLENGQPAGAGDYRIDVQSGATHLSKDIQIKLKPTGN
jgi:FlgD Ig-like domain